MRYFLNFLINFIIKDAIEKAFTAQAILPLYCDHMIKNNFTQVFGQDDYRIKTLPKNSC